jgi:hypothetical protein
MTIYLKIEQLELYCDRFCTKLIDKDYPEETIQIILNRHLQNDVVIKYTKAWQDDILQYLISICLNVPGGYWILQDYCRMAHVEFEHYSLRGQISYEKGNVGVQTARRELSPEAFDDFERNVLKSKDL